MVRFPKAKINLGLYVTERRTDGYHNIESVFYPVPITDALEAVRADHHRCALQTQGLPIDGDPSNNLIVRAWQLMSERHGIGGVDAYLIKRIPMGAGLGGGSSNGAHMLLLLNELFALELSTDILEAYAAELGSDCPFFIRETPALVTGRGEIMEPIGLALAGRHLVILHPGIHISTKEAYALVTPCRADRTLRNLADHPIGRWKTYAVNDFEKPITERHPLVKHAIALLEQAGGLFTSMSGSGSAVFGIFEAPPELETPEGWSRHDCAL
jgi:4-diphosphocytidyl-2-C-methyl-D-erythritol kinase